MRVREVALVVAVACSESRKTHETAKPAPQQATQSPIADERSVDGRMVVRDGAAPWCFDDRKGSLGGACHYNADGCNKQRNDMIGRYVVAFGDTYEKAMLEQGMSRDDAKREGLAAARSSADERLGACAVVSAAACMNATDIASGFEDRICMPTVAECERIRRDLSKGKDVRVGSECFVWRSRL